MADIRRILDNVDRTEIETYINEVDQRLIGVDEGLQNQINTNKNNISANAGNIETNRQSIETNRKSINQNADNISNLATELDDRANTLQTNINNLTTTVANNKTELNNTISDKNQELRNDINVQIQNLQEKDIEIENAIGANVATLQGNIDDVSSKLNTLADSDDTTLDQLSEVVAYIKNNKSLIDGVTTSKVNYADIVDNLTTTNSKKVLSATQGKTLKGLIDSLQTSMNGLTYSDVGADASGTADAKVSAHNTASDSHSDIRNLITELTLRITELEFEKSQLITRIEALENSTSV